MTPHDEALLAAIGREVRRERERAGWTRPELAERSGLSVRFLGQVEQGQGNIAVTRLARLAAVLGLDLGALLTRATGERKRPVLALLGLRGAGKSSLGTEVAARCGIAFAEHDARVEEREGMSLAELFMARGEDGYRLAARAALDELIDEATAPTLLATSGGIVGDRDAYDRLLGTTHTLWLAATPHDHWERVVAQGDRRPMRDRPDARRELEQLLSERRGLYGRAAHKIDTSALGRTGSAAQLERVVRDLFGITIPSLARGSG